MNIHPRKSNTALRPAMSNVGKTNLASVALAVLGLLCFAGIAQAVDNTGTGGTITYTDANGLNPVASPPYFGGYVVHKFTASGTLNVPTSTTADVLVVGGGGGGGRFGAGGGAGGFLANTAPITGGTNYSVTVGAGGAGTSTQGAVGDSGGNSVFQSITAYGGGGGGSRTSTDSGVAGAPGGSGGGGSATDSGAASGGAGTSGQGNAGGNVPWTSGYFWGSGGGGGAGAAGGPATGPAPATSGGAGGVGLSSGITGSTVFYAGGGGGGTFSGSSGTAGTGGNGGGGAGSKVDAANGNAGTVNTGGGGGGGGLNATGGTGGTGIVIVKYPYDSGGLAVAVTAPTNNQAILFGSSITATATVVNGTAPFSVTFYKQTNGGGFTPVGSPDTDLPYQVSLGTLAAGTYQIFATVSDSASGTATSATNTFVVYEEGNTGAGGTIVYTDANGLNPRALPPYTNGYVVHKFTANGTLNVPSPVTANVLVVAGGGGGGTNGGGGGGAGGLIYDNAYNVAAGSIPVTVGGGGAVHPNDASNPTNGGNSVFNSITALGGGGGSSRDAGGPGASGGSGGGGGGAEGGSRYYAGAGTPGQGNNGGNGAGAGGIDNTGGGGGGAGSAGTAGVAGVAGNGGTGVSYPIFADIAGSPAGWFAGGGAGQRVFAGSNGTAGQGGGGAAGSPGVANTGGGGGGGGIGGSGIVLVRYPYQVVSLALVTRNPADNAVDVAANANLVATFTSAITAGGGNITLYNLTDATTLATIAVTDGSQVSISGNTLTINPTSDLPFSKEIAVWMDAGTVQDPNNNPFAGFNDNSWTFTVFAPDVTAPILSSLSPADDSVRVSPLTHLVATFSENIAVGTGNILIKNLTDNLQTAIAVTDGSQVSVSGNRLTINPTGNFLSGGKNYAIRIPSGAIVDLAAASNSFAGINDDTTWNFTTSPFQVNNFADGSDSATGINTAITYTHLIDINKDADTANINGVIFNNTGAYSLTGTGNALPNNPANGATPGTGMSVVLDNFLFEGTSPTLTLSGLTSGQTYKLRIYVSGWAGALENFTFDDTSPATVVGGVDRGAWQTAPSSFDYTYTLSEGDTDLAVQIAPQTEGNTFHWFAFSNEVVNPPNHQTTFQSWATGNETFNGDANGDGIADGLAWFLGAASPSVNAQGKMPIPTKVGGFLNLSFQRVNPYAPATLYLQFGNNLSNWTELEIPDTSTLNLGGTGVQVEVVSGTPDLVTVKIPTSYESASGTLFTRLRAAE